MSLLTLTLAKLKLSEEVRKKQAIKEEREIQEEIERHKKEIEARNARAAVKPNRSLKLAQAMSLKIVDRIKASQIGARILLSGFICLGHCHDSTAHPYTISSSK